MWDSPQRLTEQDPDDHYIHLGHDYGRAPEATLGAQKRENPALAHTAYAASEKEWFLTEH